MRSVALFASQRSSDEFNKVWPAVGEDNEVKKVVWGSQEDRDEIMKAHKIVLK